MPNYHCVKKKDLNVLLLSIRKYLCGGTVTFPTLCICLVWLYEYCVCMSYMLLNNSDTVSDKVVNATTLKNFLSLKGEKLSFIVNDFMRVRNGIAHGDIECLYSIKIPSLLHESDFYKLLSMLSIDTCIHDSLRNFNEFIGFNSETYLMHKLSSKVNLLPEASVKNCSTVADCEELLSEVGYLLQ